MNKIKKRQYYPTKKYEVLESKVMIIVFKRHIFNLLSWKYAFDKEYYSCEEDETMITIIEKKKQIKQK